MKDKPNIDDLEVAISILQYMVSHPSAKDTLEGIATWWILSQRIEQSIGRVRSALQYLEDLSFVHAHTMCDHREIFALNPAMISEIKRILGRGAFDEYGAASREET